MSTAGELTALWVPDQRHEAMRDLARARQAVKKDLQGKRQQISSLRLRPGRIYPDDVGASPHEMANQRIAFEGLLEGIRQESEARRAFGKRPSAGGGTRVSLLSKSAQADGVSGSPALRKLDRRQGQARQHHCPRKVIGNGVVPAASLVRFESD